MTWLKHNWFILIFAIIILGFFISPSQASAHQSGCHRWHSCPSDSGSYTCGDLGYACQYPTYPAAGGGVVYPPSGSSGGSYYNYNYISTPTPTPSCPFMSSYNSLSGTCECYSGYVVDGNSCTSGTSYCWNKYGYNSSYSSLDKSCECDYGYELKYGTCTRIEKETTSNYPLYYPTPTPKSTCPLNSHASLTNPDKCTCDTGYDVNASKTGCVAVTENELCQNTYGINVYGKDGLCYCKNGYQWNSGKTACYITLTTPTPTPIPTPNFQNISNQAKINLNKLKEPLPSPTPISCKEGSLLSLDKKRCVKIPQNAHPANDGKNVWLCNDGYAEKGNSCVLISPTIKTTSTTNTPVQNKKGNWGIFKFW